jgi:hypothetical protein
MKRTCDLPGFAYYYYYATVSSPPLASLGRSTMRA